MFNVQQAKASATRNFKELIEILSQYDDDDAVQNLKSLQKQFDDILQTYPNTPNREVIYSTFKRQWRKFKKEFDSQEYPNIATSKQIFDTLGQINNVCKVFKSQQNVPIKNGQDYLDVIDDIRKYVNYFKKGCNTYQILTEDDYKQRARDFSNEMKTSYVRILRTSPNYDIDNQIDSLTELVLLLKESICNSMPYISRPESLNNLSSLFEELFTQEMLLPTPPSSSRHSNSPPLPPSPRYNMSPGRFDIPETITRQQYPLAQFRTELIRVSRHISQYATEAKGALAHSLIDESVRIAELAESDICVDQSAERERLLEEIERYKGMAQILNGLGGQSAPVDADTLRKLSKEQLIVVAQGRLADGSVPLPFELKVANGAPEDFRELGRRYEELRRYSEETAAQLQHQQVALLQLKAENKRLKVEANASANEAQLREELAAIDARRRQIADLVKASMMEGRTMTRGGTRSTADKYRGEVEQLQRRREEVQAALDAHFDSEAGARIALLERENERLRAAVDEKIEELREVRMQLVDKGRGKRDSFDVPPFKRGLY